MRAGAAPRRGAATDVPQTAGAQFTRIRRAMLEGRRLSISLLAPITAGPVYGEAG